MLLSKIAQFEEEVKSLVREYCRKMRINRYLSSDRRPWSAGYAEYKENYIKCIISDSNTMRDLRDGRQLPEGFGFRLDERCIEIPMVISHLTNKEGLLLDAGSSLNFEYPLRLPEISRLKKTIITLAPEKTSFPALGVSYVFDDLRSLPFRDDMFDFIACISTIEHVGMDNSMYTGIISENQNLGVNREHPGFTGDLVNAIHQLKRVLKGGGTMYLTFPFGKHENHGFFQQFDSRLTDLVIETFAPSEIREIIYKYQPMGWVLSNRSDCADCEYFNVHTSKYFNPESTIEYAEDYAAGVRAVMCLELKK